MPVWNLLEHVGTEPFPEFHHPLLMAGGTEMTALAGEGQKIFMVAIPALHPGKAVVQVATVQVAVNDLLEVRPPEPVRPFEPLLVDLNKGLKMVLHAPVIIRRLRVPGTVNGGRSGYHWKSIGFRVSCFRLWYTYTKLERRISKGQEVVNQKDRGCRAQGKMSSLNRSSPIKKAFSWSYPVEIHGRFYILVVQYVPM
jgi:hypothetical protein